MNCKNCATELETHSKFCPQCGGEVVTIRITLQKLISDFLSKAFGWDNRLFKTLRTLFTKPELVSKSYIDGVRNRFTSPVVFFAICIGVSLLIFSQFSDQYLKINNKVQDVQFESFRNMESLDLKTGTIEEIEKKKARISELKVQMNGTKKANEFMLKNYNLLSFGLLPLYAFIAFLVFRKPYNYGEHFIINAYIQGLWLLGTAIMFLLALLIHPMIYYFTFVLGIIYYLYHYGRRKAEIGLWLLEEHWAKVF